MPRPDDPFPAAQHQVQIAWNQLEEKWKKVKVMGKGGDELDKDLLILERDVDELAMAVNVAKRDWKRFGLKGEEVGQREKFVQTMKANIQQRKAYVRNMATSNQNDENQVFIEDQMQVQESIMRRQDEELEHLKNAVERIGEMGLGMHETLEEQGQLLDQLGDDMDDTMSRFKVVRRRLDRFVEETGPKQFCTILILAATFIFLTFLVATT